VRESGVKISDCPSLPSEQAAFDLEDEDVSARQSLDLFHITGHRGRHLACQPEAGLKKVKNPHYQFGDVLVDLQNVPVMVGGRDSAAGTEISPGEVNNDLIRMRAMY
jgi:hypothetical protein